MKRLRPSFFLLVLCSRHAYTFFQEPKHLHKNRRLNRLNAESGLPPVKRERLPVRLARGVDKYQQRVLRKTARLGTGGQLAILFAVYAGHTALLSGGCLAFPIQLIPNELGLFQSLGYDSVAGLSVLALRGAYLVARKEKDIKNKAVPWKINKKTVPTLKRLTTLFFLLILAYLGSGLAAVFIDEALFEAEYHGVAISMGMHRSLHVLLSHLVWVLGGATILKFGVQHFFPHRKDNESHWFRLKPREHWLPWALGGYFISALVFNCADALNQLVVPECLFEDDTIVSYMINPEDNDIAALATGAIAPCLTAPWWEELAYRGFLLPVLAAHFPLAAALPISAILFSAHHATLTAGLPLAILGLMWAYIYIQSRNLLVTILIHGMWNARVFLGALFGI